MNRESGIDAGATYVVASTASRRQPIPPALQLGQSPPVQPPQYRLRQPGDEVRVAWPLIIQLRFQSTRLVSRVQTALTDTSKPACPIRYLGQLSSHRHPQPGPGHQVKRALGRT